MKTNQVMIRPMGQFNVEQRTKDSFFNATALMKQWNDATNSKKSVNHYLGLAATKEFFQAIIEDDNNIRNHERPMSQVFVKSPARTDKFGKRIAGEVWLNPIAFIDFAMWLNPAFKVKVIKFVYDQMIAYRNEAGDAYRELSSAVAKIVAPNFMQPAMRQLAQAINYCVFNEHETAIRNKRGEESKMRRLFELERKVASLIDEGFITKFGDVVEYLRNQWRKANTPKIFLNAR